MGSPKIEIVGSYGSYSQNRYRNTSAHNTKLINVQKKNNEDEYADNHYDYEQLFDDYEKLFESGEFADIKLVVQNNALRGHKNILAARSPIFLSMLSGQENLNEIEINDIDYGIMRIVLRFIYCGKLDDLDLESGKKVFVVAKKYLLPRLINICRNIIKKKMTIDNVFDVGCFSESVDDEEIKNYVTDFLKDNARQLEEADLKKFSSDILAKVIKKIIA